MTVRILRMLVFSALQVRHTSCTACVYIHTYLEDVRLFVHLLLVILLCVGCVYLNQTYDEGDAFPAEDNCNNWSVYETGIVLVCM